MFKYTYIVICFLFLSFCTYSQDALLKLQNYRPQSPVAFEFSKYTDIPVSEYTGIPNINVPLYTIEEDGVTIPINLSYHAGGIRVAQEASWVGLGWDLTFGSVVQEINDVDDYSPYTNIVRLRPDYKWYPHPAYFPTKYTYPNCLNTNGIGWSNPYPVDTYDGKYSIMISSANWIPINGDFDNQQLGEKILSWQEYDSEPDIFRANFLGHSIKFCRNFSGGGIIILNEKGYIVNRTGDDFIITTPQGDKFYFEIHADLITQTYPDGGLQYTNADNYNPNSKIWYLTKIVTRNKRTVQFSYLETIVTKNYPTKSQRFDKLVSPVSTYRSLTGVGSIENFQSYSNPNGPLATEMEILSTTTCETSEKRFYLNSISFTNGRVDFSTSPREDMLEGRKLDSILVYSSKLLFRYTLHFGYFDATTVNGGPLNQGIYGNTGLYRLKLLQITQNDGSFYLFNYNTNPLPPKNSNAQDYWGFYNGAHSNNSLIPNPARLNIPGLSDNGNNNSANLFYAQSGVLTEIRYPTGGKSTFEYELNSFNNYWLPDYSSTSNTISTGNGLRIKSIQLFTSSNVPAKKTVYTYDGGKDLARKVLYRNISYTNSKFATGLGGVLNNKIITSTTFSLHQIDAGSFYSTNSLGSMSCVGYDKVIKEDVSETGVAFGRTVTEFNNNPDLSYNSAALPESLGISMPYSKNPAHPENGTIKKISYFSNGRQDPIKIVTNSYSTINSTIQYGARIFGYLSLFYPADNCFNLQQGPYWDALPQYVIGYYPIFDIKSLLVQSEITEYDDFNNQITTVKGYSYNGYNQLSYESLTSSRHTSGYNHQSQNVTIYASEEPLQVNPMASANRHTEPSVTFKRESRGPSSFYPHYYDYDKISHEYISLGDKQVKSRSIINKRPGVGENPEIINFDQYDAFANLLEYTATGLKYSMLWGYSGKYVIAEVKNAAWNDIAYTSFEAEGKGNFIFSGLPVTVQNAYTGNKTYQLSNGDISKTVNPGKSYTISLWSKNGLLTLNGQVPHKSGPTYNGFTYKEWNLTGTNEVILSGTAEIDEVRLHPSDAQMTTYTYEPLVGLLSSCDINNNVTYYEYDQFYRLKIIKDKEGNILKRMEYLYGQ